ncbi:MAG: hypothetical protein ACFB6S_10990 [Geminicoccaceae bacterium]
MINAGGEVYFIEGGIKGHKIGHRRDLNLDGDGSLSIQGNVAAGDTVQLIDDSKLLTMENEFRSGGTPSLDPRVYPTSDAGSGESNIGVALIQAYSVFVESKEVGIESVTANDDAVSI